MNSRIMPSTKHKAQSTIILWLTFCALLVVAMVAVGGYTRLSGSGLSITEWKPIHGVIPPRGEVEWQEELDKYRQIPQYHAINKGMTLNEFKQIFWPEYFHRLLGRIIGIVFMVPLIFFWVRGSIDHRMGFRLLAIFSLGGLQGAMGWYMVASGLSENVYVSHFRLAAHLGLALLLLALLVWQILGVEDGGQRTEDKQSVLRSPSSVYRLWFALLCLQILYGALVAGLHAGLIYNTWPTMEGKWLPPLTSAIFTDHATVQFIHRWAAALVALGFGFWWFFARSCVKDRKLAGLVTAVACVIALQFILGVLTLVNAVPLALGMVHQLTAVLLFVLAVVLLHRIR